MRLVFMGTPEFAVPALEALAESHEVLAVYTRPDAVSGRGSKTRPSAVTQAATALGLEVRQPHSLRDHDVQLALAALSPDAIIVAAYGLILPREVLEIPRYGCINIHGSLLPRWRGAAPVQRAILAGDEYTGVSIMRMEEGLDTGPFCETERVVIVDKGTAELTTELAQAGARALLRALVRIQDGDCDWQMQDDSQATYAEKVTKDDVRLDPSLSLAEALRRIRASSDQAPARLIVGERAARVISAEESFVPVPEGGVACDKNALSIGFADGALELFEVKPEGKSMMRACEWARGARLDQGASWQAAR